MERRQFGRRNTSKAGWLLIPGRPRISCKIKNVSPKGALIELEVPSWLPFRFELLVEPENEVQVCEIRHVLSGAIGVQFVASASRLSSIRTKDEVAEWMGDDELAK
jgi:hypothetical protein